MLEKDDLFEVDDKLYVVFEEVNYEGNDYCFCNEMLNEKTFGKNYVVFQNFDDGIEEVFDQGLLNKLIPLFTREVNTELINSYEENMGEE